MDVDLIFKVAAIGLLAAVINILLQRSGRDEQALMTTIAALVVVLMMLVQKISELSSRCFICDVWKRSSSSAACCSCPAAPH